MLIILTKLEALATILPNEIATAVPSLPLGRLAMTVTLRHCERSEAISYFLIQIHPFSIYPVNQVNFLLP